MEQVLALTIVSAVAVVCCTCAYVVHVVAPLLGARAALSHPQSLGPAPARPAPAQQHQRHAQRTATGSAKRTRAQSRRERRRLQRARSLGLSPMRDKGGAKLVASEADRASRLEDAIQQLRRDMEKRRSVERTWMGRSPTTASPEGESRDGWSRGSSPSASTALSTPIISGAGAPHGRRRAPTPKPTGSPVAFQRPRRVALPTAKRDALDAAVNGDVDSAEIARAMALSREEQEARVKEQGDLLTLYESAASARAPRAPDPAPPHVAANATALALAGAGVGAASALASVSTSVVGGRSAAPAVPKAGDRADAKHTTPSGMPSPPGGPISGRPALSPLPPLAASVMPLPTSAVVGGGGEQSAAVGAGRAPAGVRKSTRSRTKRK